MRENPDKVLEDNVEALLTHWGMNKRAASMLMGPRENWLADLFRSDRSSIRLSRLADLVLRLSSPELPLTCAGMLTPGYKPWEEAKKDS
jgi:hypothetical protein